MRSSEIRNHRKSRRDREPRLSPGRIGREEPVSKEIHGPLEELFDGMRPSAIGRFSDLRNLENLSETDAVIVILREEVEFLDDAAAVVEHAIAGVIEDLKLAGERKALELPAGVLRTLSAQRRKQLKVLENAPKNDPRSMLRLVKSEPEP